MGIMKKVWFYKRTGTKGWWVGWYESGKRKAKQMIKRTGRKPYAIPAFV
jgi:hypothetical protein